MLWATRDVSTDLLHAYLEWMRLINPKPPKAPLQHMDAGRDSTFCWFQSLCVSEAHTSFLKHSLPRPAALPIEMPHGTCSTTVSSVSIRSTALGVASHYCTPPLPRTLEASSLSIRMNNIQDRI